MAKINHPHIVNEERVARSGVINLRVSTKNSIEICGFIKGLAVDTAIGYLEDVVVKKKAVPFKRFIKDQAHRKGGMGPGRYPVNAAREIIKLLKNARNNAEMKDFDAERLVVDNAQANLCGSSFYRGARAFGRRHSKSTNISITVKEKKAESKDVKAEKKPEIKVKTDAGTKVKPEAKVDDKKADKVKVGKVEAEKVKTDEATIEKKPVSAEKDKAETKKAEAKGAVDVPEKETKKQ
ncbi:MAG: 50S ribosomal protein L22 [archaeon]|nr:50S ribosomal protein L22 [archaeon]